MMNATATWDDESIESRRVPKVQPWFYTDATLCQARCGADAKCSHTVATGFTTVVVLNRCSGKNLGGSSQIHGRHLLEYNQTNRFWNHSVTRLRRVQPSSQSCGPVTISSQRTSIRPLWESNLATGREIFLGQKVARASGPPRRMRRLRYLLPRDGETLSSCLRLPRVSTHHERNGQADAKHVNERLRPSHRAREYNRRVQIQAANPREKRRRTKVIDCKNRQSIKQAHRHRMPQQHRKTPTQRVENRRHGQRHREMQREAERAGCESAFICTTTQQTAGHAFQYAR